MKHNDQKFVDDISWGGEGTTEEEKKKKIFLHVFEDRLDMTFMIFDDHFFSVKSLRGPRRTEGGILSIGGLIQMLVIGY